MWRPAGGRWSGTSSAIHVVPIRSTKPRKALLDGPLGPAAGVGDTPFALDVEARMAALERTQAFRDVEHRSSTWSRSIPEQTVALYATYSNVSIRPDREAWDRPSCVAWPATSSTAA